jgi:hypothetical protein
MKEKLHQVFQKQEAQGPSAQLMLKNLWTFWKFFLNGENYVQWFQREFQMS